MPSCSAQAGRFLRGFPGRAAALRRPQLQQPCAKRAWIGSPRKHPPRARRFFCRAASAPEGSEKIRATRRAQDRRSPLTVKRTRAGAPPTPQRAIATLAQRPARHAHGATPRKSGSPAGTRRHRGLCRIAGRRRPRATTPCRCACPPNAHGPPQNFVLFSQDNVMFDSTPPFKGCVDTKKRLNVGWVSADVGLEFAHGQRRRRRKRKRWMARKRFTL